MSDYLLFLIAPVLLAFWAQARVSAAFSKYSRIGTASNLTGAQTAQRILDAAQIHDVEVVQIDGLLGDHYDPTTKRLCLSSQNYNNSSLAAVGIAAHETGHAIQHARAYVPLQARMAIVPATSIASKLAMPIFFAGFIFRAFALLKLAVVAFAVLAVFQLITLPVEFDASRRAKIILGHMGIIQPGPEAKGVNDMLNAAALTYVAAFAAALGQFFLYFFNLTQRRN